MWDQWKQANDPAKADAIFRKILDLAADGFEVIGTVQGVTTFGVRNKKLINVPAKIPNSWDYATPGPTQLQQYSFAP